MTSEVTRTLQRIVEEVKNMTPEEFRQSLFRAGIANEDGTLRPTSTKRRPLRHRNGPPPVDCIIPAIAHCPSDRVRFHSCGDTPA